MALNASQMYANNLFNLVSEFWQKDSKQFAIDLEDDIQKSAVITHQGDITNQTISELRAQQETQPVEQAS